MDLKRNSSDNIAAGVGSVAPSPNIRRVSALAGLEEAPAWSPESRRIAYQGAVVGNVGARNQQTIPNRSHQHPEWFPHISRVGATATPPPPPTANRAA